MKPEHTFKLRQGGIVVAEVTGAVREEAFREIMHYAAVYSQDGDCTVEGVTLNDWTAFRANPVTLQ